MASAAISWDSAFRGGSDWKLGTRIGEAAVPGPYNTFDDPEGDVWEGMLVEEPEEAWPEGPDAAWCDAFSDNLHRGAAPCLEVSRGSYSVVDVSVS